MKNYTVEDIKFPTTLQFLQVTTISLQECLGAFKHLESVDKQEYEMLTNNINKFKLCTKNYVGSGACVGDSGGPVVANETLIGITSWARGCSDGYPDVHTLIYPYVKWINDKMNELESFRKSMADIGLESFYLS